MYSMNNQTLENNHFSGQPISSEIKYDPKLENRDYSDRRFSNNGIGSVDNVLKESKNEDMERIITDPKVHSDTQKLKEQEDMKYMTRNSIEETAHSENMEFVRLKDAHSDLDSDFSRQSSESPSPLPHDKDFGSHHFEQKNTSSEDEYLSNKFFIDDTNKPDQISYSENNRDLFDLTPDQEQALRELRQLKQQQVDFDDDYDYSLNYDYDVREKLESLNAQLANEPTPPEPEHRNSKVVFREELVSLVAPPEEYGLSDSEQEEPSEETVNQEPVPVEPFDKVEFSSPVVTNEGTTSPSIISQTTNQNPSPEIISQQSSSNAKTDDVEEDSPDAKETDTQVENKNENNIVISRGGDFQLIDENEMIGASRSSDEISVNHNDKNKPRPVSAPTNKRNRNDTWSHLQFDSLNSSTKSELSIRSQNDKQSCKYIDVPKVDRQLLQRQKEREEGKRKEQKEREELEAKNKREMNDKCFNAWLQSKNKAWKEDSERKKKEEEEERKNKEKTQEERRALAQEKEKELNKNLEQQKRREEKLQQYRIKEIEESSKVHTKEECRKAFKSWIKKKRQSQQVKQNEEKQKARITRLAMRQCRKSQNLAQAIHQANSFRYLDFYGYP